MHVISFEGYALDDGHEHWKPPTEEAQDNMHCSLLKILHTYTNSRK